MKYIFLLGFMALCSYGFGKEASQNAADSTQVSNKYSELNHPKNKEALNLAVLEKEMSRTRHLPGLPSIQEMQEGYDATELNMKMVLYLERITGRHRRL